MSIKFFAGLLVVLASIVYANVTFFPQEAKAPSSVSDTAPSASHSTTYLTTHERCPEDAVRFVTLQDRTGFCEAVDDVPAELTELRNAATSQASTCPTGTGVVEISDTDVVGWCNTQEGNT